MYKKLYSKLPLGLKSICEEPLEFESGGAISNRMYFSISTLFNPGGHLNCKSL